MAEQEVTYTVGGQKKTFRIKRITYGEYQKAVGGIGNVELLGGVTRSKFDLLRVVDELMKVAVVCPEGVDYRQLDVVDGLDLQARVLSYNGLGSEAAPAESFRAKSG